MNQKLRTTSEQHIEVFERDGAHVRVHHAGQRRQCWLHGTVVVDAAKVGVEIEHDRRSDENRSDGLTE